MAILTHKCPHCLTEHIGLRSIAFTQMTFGWIGYFACPKCDLPSCAKLSRGRDGVATPNNINGDVSNYGYQIEEFWPAVPGPAIPDSIPPAVERSYLQAERNFVIEGNEEASGTMYRKALDVGLKWIDATLRGSLHKRIEALAKSGRITADIAAWAHDIRALGNEAAHDDEPPSREELTALRDFSDAVLRYLFTLPGLVAKRQGKALPWEAGDAD